MKLCDNCGICDDNMKYKISGWNFCTACARAYHMGFKSGLEEGRRQYETKDPPWSMDQLSFRHRKSRKK